MRKAEIKRKFDEIVDFSGVERYIDTPVKRYSSGMYVRLAFAVAAHLESEILIVDEVLAVGDAEFQKKCLGKMGEVSKGEGRTVLFVSHNMDAVKALCNRGMLLDKGAVSFRGDIFECCEKYLSLYTKTEIKNSKISHLQLNEKLSLDEFSLDKDSYATNEKLVISLRLSATRANKITGMALLVYNIFDVRVGIFDLRVLDLEPLSNDHLSVKITIQVQNMPLIAGSYKLGLWIDSLLCSGNFFNLVNLEIVPYRHDTFVKYPANILGYFDPVFSGKITYE